MRARPNIVFFLTDDHGAWALPSYGNSEIVAPAFDRLATEGTQFDNVYSPCPVCSPARACVLTGRTPSQVGIHDWIENHFPEFNDPDWLDDEITLPQLLNDEGYHCGLSGKWHMGLTERTPRGFDWCFGIPGGQGIHNSEFTYHLNDVPTTLTGNKTQFVTDYALEFLDAASQDRPFYLQIGYITTHSPWSNQEPEMEALYENATFRDIPPYVPHPWHKNEGFPQGQAFTEEQCVRAYRAYYAAVSEIDRNLARVLSKLDELGLAENTVVVYTSDHGLTLGHHGFWGKGNSTRPLNMYETSLRVPLIWRGPGVPLGAHVADNVDHYDTFQSICDLAGVDLSRYASRNYPGRAYNSVLAGQPLVDWDQTEYGEYGDLRMIRTPEFKLVRRYPDGPDDLFDLANDPGETLNLADDPRYTETRSKLLVQLESWYAQHDDPAKSGLRVKQLRQHNRGSEAWRDGLRESRGLQVY